MLIHVGGLSCAIAEFVTQFKKSTRLDPKSILLLLHNHQSFFKQFNISLQKLSVELEMKLA